MMFDNIPGPLGLMRGGKVKGFAVTSKERHPAVPDMPTMAEFLPGFEITSWGGICGPAGLPPAMVEKLSALTKKALESAAVKEAFDKQGATRVWMSPPTPRPIAPRTRSGWRRSSRRRARRWSEGHCRAGTSPTPSRDAALLESDADRRGSSRSSLRRAAREALTLTARALAAPAAREIRHERPCATDASACRPSSKLRSLEARHDLLAEQPQRLQHAAHAGSGCRG